MEILLRESTAGTVTIKERRRTDDRKKRGRRGL